MVILLLVAAYAGHHWHHGARERWQKSDHFRSFVPQMAPRLIHSVNTPISFEESFGPGRHLKFSFVTQSGDEQTFCPDCRER